MLTRTSFLLMFILRPALRESCSSGNHSSGKRLHYRGIVQMRRLVTQQPQHGYTISAATAGLTPGCRRAQFRHMEGLHEVHTMSPLIPVLHAQTVVLAVNMVVMVHILQHRETSMLQVGALWYGMHDISMPNMALKAHRSRRIGCRPPCTLCSPTPSLEQRCSRHITSDDLGCSPPLST